MLWIAPEVLRNHPSHEISQAADVFSFAIISYEMCTRSEPYISEPWYISIAGKFIQDLINHGCQSRLWSAVCRLLVF